LITGFGNEGRFLPFEDKTSVMMVRSIARRK